MIDRTFDGLKFKRTYLGGSKEKEELIFKEVQGDPKKEYEDCDWIGFRNVITKHYDDKLNVIFSWRYLFKHLSIGFALVTLILLLSYFYYHYSNQFLWVVGTTFGLSLLMQIPHLYYSHEQDVELRNYDLGLTITGNEIEKNTGIKLKKNP